MAEYDREALGFAPLLHRVEGICRKEKRDK